MSRDLFPDRRRADLREQAALVKARLGCEEVLEALGLDTGAGRECPDPLCGAFGEMRVGPSGWRCSACGKSGDAIAMVRLKKNVGFAGACEFLESLKRSPRDGRTADLFAAGGKRR